MTDTHIKINAVTPKVQYTGNGSTTVFPYTFAIFANSDMVVYLDDEIQESGYTISGAGQSAGGDVTFTNPPDDGVIVTLIRNIPIERVTDFQEGGTFRPKNINDELDRITAIEQQLAEEVSRSVKFSPTSPVSELVIADAIPNRALKWNDDASTVKSSTYDPDEVASIAETAAENAENSATSAESSANTATWYAENCKFGVSREVFSSGDWQQSDGKYKIFVADQTFIQAVYKKNASNNYEYIQNIDFIVSDSGTTIVSLSPFDGYYLQANGVRDTFTYVQTTPSDTWDIVHNLGKKPVFVFVDDNDTVIQGGVVYNSLNEMTVTFTEEISGKAYLY
ncbi:MAG: hypothetical protein J6S85_03895 [Methanobrevibacter sp.]|nr:hypothetical protein [Methanobrevibacter sp.]MBO7712685.1 hypothetical protein [Methanobrevibacter sp.]